MDRRSFLLSAAAYSLPIPSGNAMHFRILRNGDVVGDHYIEFKQSSGNLAISISMGGLVKVAGITVFRYTVKATEYWQDGVFQGVDSAVNNNGTPLEIHAERIANGYSVYSTLVPRYVAPPNLLPLTYWNKAMLNGMILNISTGHSYPPIVHSPGWNALPTANAGLLTAQRFDVTGKLHLSVWYDQNHTWSGLEFQRMGGDFNYEKYV
jgi:hypothetical protein